MLYSVAVNKHNKVKSFTVLIAVMLNAKKIFEGIIKGVHDDHCFQR